MSPTRSNQKRCTSRTSFGSFPLSEVMFHVPQNLTLLSSPSTPPSLPLFWQVFSFKPQVRYWFYLLLDSSMDLRIVIPNSQSTSLLQNEISVGFGWIAIKLRCLCAEVFRVKSEDFDDPLIFPLAPPRMFYVKALSNYNWPTMKDCRMTFMIPLGWMNCDNFDDPLTHDIL